MHSTAEAVLVVEDDPGTRMLLKILIERLELRALVAEGGERALELVRADLPALILLDLMMPGMNGFQFLRAYRDEIDADTPVIVLSAKDDPVDRAWAESLGVIEYVAKPFDGASLGERIVSTIADAKSPARGGGDH